ncbi:hypothetical protein [Stenotrophomonas sp. CFBP8994]|uniref:hypothetical protein n=1 Tax=Stenotrophomonas sp. CFBP8994 TaxID=3096527 RepID=UPI002A6A4A91|nr:hypothetical protein [Stenotrophomonas sp. CFBP8994]MDY0978630.1 hypothetical protein [Stenotrophomonas sp. CFBP8994]
MLDQRVTQVSSSTEEQFIEAARTGDLVTLRALLAQVDPKAQRSKALAVAAMNARLQAALVLYPLSDPEAIEHWCHLRQGTDPELILRMVEWARAGSVGPGSPSEYSRAMAIAAEEEHEGLMGLLYLHCCPAEAVSYCQERAWFAASRRLEAYFLDRATPVPNARAVGRRL